MYDYEGRIFCSVSNSANGEVNNETIFHYHQDKDIVWGEYSGGNIARGMLIARVQADGVLDMRYQHVNMAGKVMTGICTSTPEVLPDGRYRMHEEWQWTSGDQSSGTSIIEEVPRADLLGS